MSALLQGETCLAGTKRCRATAFHTRVAEKIPDNFPVFPDVSTYFLIFPDQGGEKV